MSDPKIKAAPAKPAAPKPASAKPDAAAAKAPAEPQAPRSRLSWMAGWVLVPGLIIGTLFGGGVLVGAHFPDSWLPRMVVWIVELFA